MRLQRLKGIERYEVAVAGAVILAMAAISGPMIVIVIPLFVILISVLQCDRGPVATVLSAYPAQFLGRISYSVYMVHSLIIVCLLIVMKRLVPMSFDPGIGRVLVTITPWLGDLLVFGVVGAVLIVASRTYVLIEEPGRKFGRRRVLPSAVLHAFRS